MDFSAKVVCRGTSGEYTVAKRAWSEPAGTAGVSGALPPNRKGIEKPMPMEAARSVRGENGLFGFIMTGSFFKGFFKREQR